MKEYFGSKEPTKINYCSNCLQQVKDRCPSDSCKGAALSSFLDLHFEEKIKDLFRDSEFLTLLKQGKEQIKRAVSSSGIHDTFHGMDYKLTSYTQEVFFRSYITFLSPLILMESKNIPLPVLVICGLFTS